MKKYSFILLIVVSIVSVLLFSCTDPGTGSGNNGNDTGSLNITYTIEEKSRILLPGIDMTPASYVITGSGPDNAQFSVDTTVQSVVVKKLAFGAWTVVVDAKNSAGTVIARGTAMVTVHAGETTTVSITVSPLPGDGTLDLTVLWNAADTDIPSIEAQLIPFSGAEQTLDFTLTGAGSATYRNTSVAAGYYSLVIKLMDNGILTMGTVEVVRIVEGQVTAGTFEFYDINKAGGSIAVNIDVDMKDPLTVGMSGQTADLGLGTTISVTASVAEPVGNVIYVWYINGDSIGTGETMTVGNDLDLGIYNLDVTAFTIDGSRAGSARHTFHVVENTDPVITGITQRGRFSQNGVTGAVDVAIKGNYAYVADGMGMAVVDVTDPVNPLYITKITGNSVNDVALTGNYAIFPRAGSIRIIDISNPVSPVEAAVINAPDYSGPEGLTVAGNYLYVADGYADGLGIYDITDPVNPVALGYFAEAAGAKEVVVSGDYAYVMTMETLMVINIADPVAPVTVGTYAIPPFPADIAVNNNTVYIAIRNGSVAVVDVSDPVNPTEAALLVTPGSVCYGVHVSDNTLYAVHQEALVNGDANGGYVTYDITVPGTPVLMNTYEDSSQAFDITIDNNRAYIAAAQHGLKILDITTPATPQYLGSSERFDARHVALKGNYAYVADHSVGLKVFDISVPDSPVKVGRYDMPANPYTVHIKDTYAYVPAWNGGLYIFDISDPINPVKAGYYNDTPFDMYIDGSTAYLACDNKGLVILDITNPVAPVEIGSFDTAGRAWGVHVENSYAFVADYTNGVRIINVADPAAPVEVTSISQSNSIYNTFALDNYLYVPNNSPTSGLFIYDVTDPASPVLLSNLQYGLNDVYVSGKYLYGNGANGFTVVDVTDAANPVYIATSGLYTIESSMAVKGQYGYAASRSNGLYVYELN